MDNIKIVGLALQKLRKSKKITQLEVSQLMGRTPKTVSGMENGQGFTSKSLNMYLEAVGFKDIKLS
jgi:transcriptional regulator with XRE-family HTH domain